MRYQYCGLDGELCLLRSLEDPTDLYKISVRYYPSLLSKLSHSGEIIDLIEHCYGIELIFPIQSNQFRREKLTIFFNEETERGSINDEPTRAD